MNKKGFHVATVPRHRFEERFVKNFVLSIFAHALLVTVFTVKFVFFPDDLILIESAVRVDIVGLPDKLQELPPAVAEPIKEAKTPPAPAPAEAAKPEEKPIVKPKETKPEEKAINLNKTKDKQKQALDKLKAMSAMEKLKGEIAQQDKAKNPPQPQAVRGNVLSAGNSLTGLNKLQYDEYFGKIDLHIKNFWSLPEFMQNKDYKTQVRVQFDENGFVTSKVITRSSGNIEYDNFVLDTIQRASPLPPPPEKFQDIVKYKGIILGFPE